MVQAVAHRILRLLEQGHPFLETLIHLSHHMLELLAHVAPGRFNLALEDKQPPSGSCHPA